MAILRESKNSIPLFGMYKMTFIVAIVLLLAFGRLAVADSLIVGGSRGYDPAMFSSYLTDVDSKIAGTGRLGGALLYFKLKEPKPYPTTLEKEFNLVLERIRKAGEGIVKPAKDSQERVVKTAKKITKRIRRKKRE